MCQSKTTGSGKRCLRHQAASSAEVHFSWAKTGVDKSTIYAILKDLNKEGRKLDAPELAEVKSFLKKEEFIVKHDPELNEKDRKMILKNLAKANDEAEKQGVSGGAYHAWKNVFSKTVEKIKKPLIAAGLVGVLAISIAGCSGSVKPIDNNADSPSPSNGGIVACSTENPGPWGDVIAKEEVKDEYGTYCRTTIDPKSDALKYDASKTDTASLEKYGFTEEDAKTAQKTAVTFLAEETLDSTRLDNYSQSDSDWLKANNTWINPSAQKLFSDSAETKGMRKAGLLVTDALPTPVIRDGGPRTAGTNIQVDRIAADISTDGKTPVLVVTTSASSVYSVDNKTILETVVKNDSTKTEESLRASNPELFDASGSSSGLLLQGKFRFGFDKGNSKSFTGFSDTWTLSTGDGLLNVATE